VVVVGDEETLTKLPPVGVGEETTEALVALDLEAFNNRVLKDIGTFNVGANAAVRGCFLLGRDFEAAFLRVRKQKHAWKRWYEIYAKKHAGFSFSYADQLRSLYRNLGSFSGFQSLRIPTSKLTRHSTAIRAFLDNDEKWAGYWIQEVPEAEEA